MKAYVQLKDTTHISKEGICLKSKGQKQVFDVNASSLDEAWCHVFKEVPNCQRVLLLVE